MNRSYLFVPADSERKLKKSADIGADALILDLEDSVTADARPAARELTAEYPQGKENVWVRINPVDSPDWEADIEAVMPSRPVGIVLPKPHHARDAVKLSDVNFPIPCYQLGVELEFDDISPLAALLEEALAQCR